VQRELLPGTQLPLAGVAGEAGQVVHVVPGLADPVACGDTSAALGTLGSETSATNRKPSVAHSPVQLKYMY
jgi:hypothetical protein